MKIEGVQCTSGDELDLTMFEPKGTRTLIGFQIEHKQTGRLLPSTNNFTIFKAVAAAVRMMEVKEAYKIDTTEYEFKRVYLEHLEAGSYEIFEHDLDRMSEEG